MRVLRLKSGSIAESDAALLEAVADGDVAAFERLYRRNFRTILGFAMRLTGRMEIAEEVVSDTMMVIWNQAGSFQGRSKVTTWIIGIAYRSALSKLRRHRREARADEAAVEIDPPPSTDIETLFLRKDLCRALNRLSPMHRATMELAYSYGHSTTEIASIMDCPIGTVKTRMMHARSRLRTLLSGEDGPREEDQNG